MSYKENKELATELGIEFPGNISNDDLELLIEDAKAQKAIAEKDATVEKPKDPTPDPKLTEAQEESLKKAASIKNSTIMVKVNITPLGKNSRELSSEMFTHMSKGVTRKQVVAFRKPDLVYKVIVEMLREKEELQQVKYTNKKGREVVKLQMGKAYSIEELELTEEEIEEMKK